jgi:hypothetical protein
MWPNACCIGCQLRCFVKAETVAYFARPTLIRLRVDELQDEVLSIAANVLPVSLVEDDRVISALSDEVLKVLASEG